MKRKGLILFDILMAIVVLFGIIFGAQTSTNQLGLKESSLLAENVNRKFEFEATPDYQKKQAGETAEIKLSLKNIDMGDVGLNNVVGYLSYDETLFEEVNITGVNDWHFEQNQDKNHEMYGKFVIYTMKEGVTEGQDVATFTLKLKSDVEPQKTEVKFTKLQSSDGEVSVEEEEKTAVIEIYKQNSRPPHQDDPTKPENPDDPTDPEKPEEPAKTPEVPSKTEIPEQVEEKKEGPVTPKQTQSIKTGDNIMLISLVLAIATIMLNVMVVVKKNSDENSESGNVKTGANGNILSGKGLKVGIISAISVIAVGLIMLAVTSFAHNAEITELINRLSYKESWLNSEKYLVTDETVSRIAPLTNISDITDKFNKEIEVYKKDSNEEVTEGIVTTGMRISDKQDSYDVVVLGDINGDGESDTVELTRIIRNIVNNDKYKFNNIEKLAADMNVDNTMDMGDVNTSIKYILYGELEIPGFDQVKEPKIEVVSGTYNDKIEAYEDKVTVKVTAQDDKATQTKYKIEGTSTKPYAVIESGETFEIENNGVYKVSAYSYGELGNRSEIPYEIILKKNPNNKYKVITRAENADGTYSETTEEKTGRIGTTVTTGEEIPDGYEINEEESTLTGEIKEDEVIELVVTLDRKEYTLTLKAGSDISSVKIGDERNESTISKKFKFGKNINISADVSKDEGYTITFDRWESADKTIMADIGEKDYQIEMPMSDITLTAKANRVNNEDTKYTVEYYYQKDGIYSLTPDSSKEKNGETDKDVEVDETDKTPTKDGYVLDESKTADYRGKVAGNGELKLKVYFKQELKVTYSKGDHGTFESQVTEHIEWGTTTPAFEGELTHQEGYDFNGWSTTPADKVTETVEYVATWKEHEYTITYKLNGGTLGKDEQENDIINPEKYTISTETFTLNNPTKEGYTFKGWTGTDLNAESKNVSVEKGSTGDRAYEANWEVIDYTIEYELNDGTLGFDNEGNKITNPTSYNVETPTFALNNPKKTGYTFKGWTGTDLSSETTYVSIEKGSTGNRKYEANWRPNTGVEYKVRYYLENLDSTDSNNKDNYTLELEVPKSGVTDEEVTAEIKDFKGFTYDGNNPNNKITDKIAGDGTLVLEVYYTRNSYTLTLDKDENIESVTGAGTYKYEQNVSIDATTKKEDGYTIAFTKWKSSTADSEGTDQLDDIFDKNASFEMPAGDVTLTAISSRAANKVDYKVEFYYEVNGEYPEQTDEENIDTRQAETDTMAYVTEEDKKTTEPTYVFDDSKNGNLSGKVKGDGTLVLKVYFKQEFTVTYSKGDHGTFETQTTEHLRYNSDTPEFKGEKTHENGYEFTSWDKQKENKVTKTIEYVATWKATEYAIEYELNGGDLGTNETTGQPITNPSKYTVETPEFILNNPTKEGYTFKGWTGTDIDNIENPEQTTPQTQVTIAQGSTGNRSYEAVWEAVEYNITYNLNDGTLGKDESGKDITNPEKYTIETPTFILNNPTKTGYTFLGWTGTGIDNEENTEETTPQTQVTIAQGSIGDRAYTANWKENTGVIYHVQYYLEKLESTDKNNANNYTLKENVELDGTTNQEVTAEILPYAGFTYDENNPNNNITDNIKADGSLVLKVYYTRDSYTLTMKMDKNIATVEGESTSETSQNKVDETTLVGTFKYEEQVKIKATTKEEQGYTITFKEWTSTSTEILQSDETKKSAETSFAMPAENVTVEATSKREANTVGYTVEYYYEGESGYPDTPTYTDTTRTAKVGTEVNVEDDDKVADERNPGYKFDEDAENNILTTTIPASGTATLKVYFKKAVYTLKVVAGSKVTEIKLGEETAGEGETLEHTYMYGESITIDATVGEQTGYTIDFGKWESSNQTLMADNTTKNLTFTMPDGDITLTAVADIIPLDAKYKVKFYYQKDGVYPDEPEEINIKIRDGKTGQRVSVKNEDKEPVTEGYIYDTAADNVESTDEEGIKPDGSTTLKVYFKQQFKVTYLPGEHANFETTTIRNIDYNSDIPEYNGSLNGKDGYVFDSWKLTKIGNTEVTDETEIPTKVKANLEYTAIWKAMSKPTVTHEPTEWTNQNVTVTITAPEGYETYGKEYRIDDSTEWRTYEEPFEVEQNCIIHARLGKDDNKGEAVDHEVTNIDKINPEFSGTPTYTIENNAAIIKANVTDNLSGIVEYGIRKDIYSGYTLHTCSNTLEAELIFSDAHESGTYELYIKDAAGNSNTTTIEVEIPVHNVAKIVSAPAGYENLEGTEYESLKEALEASDTAAQAGNVKIEIIDYIDNEENTIQNGRDYTINLNNYYVKNQEGRTAITVDGKLTLLDENPLGEGTVASPFGLGIYITKSGELTLGTDGDGTPSIFSPIVEGATYGIQKEIDYNAEKVYDENKEAYYYPEGVFNFYDGKVIGGTAAFSLQRVNDTPTLYDPTVRSSEETNKEEAILATVLGVEATIGKKTYLLLEDAISDANNVIGNSNEQVEITIVRDLAKDADHKIVVDETKNIKLDLNGHTFTTTTDDYVLRNYGKLEIYDSSKGVDEETGEVIPGTGVITGSTANTIYNGISENAVKNLTYENIDLSKVVPNDDNYFFQARGNGEPGLISNNSGNVGTARSYIVLDLTDRKGMFEIVANTTISSLANHYGYITVSNQSATVDYNDTYGRKVFVTGNKNTVDDEYKFYLAGGEKYYIHLGYYKNSASGGTTNDCFIIKSMKMAEISKAGSLKLTSGTYENTKVGTTSVYTSVIDNDSVLIVNGAKIVTNKNYSTDITNGKTSEAGYLEIDSGEVTSVMRAITNNNNGVVKINGGTITKTSNSSNDIVIYNQGYLYVTGANTKIESTASGAAIANFNRGYIRIDNGNIISGSYAIENSSTYNNFDSIVINGGNFSAKNYAIYNTSTTNSKGNITINNAVILSASEGIYNANSGTITINNIDMSRTDSNGKPTITNYGLRTYGSGKIIFNGGEIYSVSSAVYNFNSGIVEINGGKLKSQNASNPTINNVCYDSVGTIKITDGTILSNGKAIENNNNGILIITGGNIETIGNYVCVDNTSRGSVTIGTKDGNVNTEIPQIKSPITAIRSSVGTINFYDGVLIGQENKTINGVFTEIEDNNYLLKEIKSDNLQYITLGIPTDYVAKIAESYNPDVSGLNSNCYKLENNYYYFITLNYAVDACNTENATTVELIDNLYLSRKTIVNENKDVTIEFNGKTVYTYAKNNIENKGKLTLKNENKTESEYGNIIQGAGQLILNNSNSEVNISDIAINYESVQGIAKNSSWSTGNYRIIIGNYGKMNISNSTYYIYCGSRDGMYAHGILNEETGIMHINGLSMSGDVQYPIENKGADGEEEKYSITIENSTISTTKGYGICNSGIGTMLVENSTMSSYNNNQNSSSGKIIINNSTISKTISNSANGSILIMGADTLTSNIINSKNGTVEIQNGTIKATSNVIDNSGTLIISGGEVNYEGSSSLNAIDNKASGTAKISGTDTKIISKYQGIKNAGTMTITGASISGNSTNGIENTGTLTLGDKDGTVMFVPVIYGKKIGIKNTKTLNFYDGIIEGPETASISGVVPTETEKDCIRVIHKGETTFDDGTTDKYSVDSGREISVLQKVDIAYVVSKDKYYTSLVDAFNEADSTDTVRMVNDASISGAVSSAEVAANKNITLDLNGYNIVAGNTETIVNNGTLTITDSTSHLYETGATIEGSFINGASTIIKNNGTCTIEKGTYGLTLGGTSSTYYDLINNTGTLNINGGTYYVSAKYSNIINALSGNVTINGGTFETKEQYDNVVHNSLATVTINGGMLKNTSSSSYSYGLHLENAGTINFADGTINASNAVYNKSTSGKINIKGGIINGQIYNYSTGQINISGGTTKYSGTAVYNNNLGEINITGGYIKGTGTAVENANAGTINIDGTELSAENPVEIIADKSSSNYAYGVINRSTSDVNIKGHVHITANNSTSYGIYNVNGGTVNVGDSSEITNNVKITAVNYGIYNLSTKDNKVNYYGGTITAKEAVHGCIQNTPDNYEIIRTVDENNNEIYEIGHTQKVASIGEEEYNTLQEAIQNCTDGTIVLIKDIVLPKSRSIIIDSSQNIMLDLNNNTIRLHNIDTSIENNGKLKIKDSSVQGDGVISGFAGNVIKNKGAFEMLSGKITLEQMPNSKIIYTTENGKVTVSGGEFEGRAITTGTKSSCSNYIIYSDNSKEITITGGTYKLYGREGSYSYRSYSFAVYTTQADAKISISDATFSNLNNRAYGDKFSVYMNAGGTVKVFGDTYSENEYGIYMNSSGVVYVSENANLDCETYGIYAYGNAANIETTVNINSGTVKQIYSERFSDASSECTINIRGGEITGETGINSHGNTQNNIVNIEGGKINTTGKGITNIKTVNMYAGEVIGSSCGIEVCAEGSVNITGGKVSGTAGPGVLITAGTLILGEDDGEYPNQTTPEIEGSTYGIQNNKGTFNYYDGILKGNTYATNGVVSSTPDMFSVIYAANGTIGTLGIESTFKQVAEVNGVFYNDLSSAVEAAIKADGTVVLCNDITTSKSITIPVGSTVTIDLYGLSINGYTESGVLFTNNGTLVIEDSRNEGTNTSTIRNYTGKAIENNGTLTIGTDDGTVYTNVPKIIGKTISIENNGTLDFVDGQIGISEDEGAIIVNNGTARKPEGYKVEKVDGVYTLVQE